MNDIDPQVWLADVIARLPDTTVTQVPDLLPWTWQTLRSPTSRLTAA
jgi:hypothetical protein